MANKNSKQGFPPVPRLENMHLFRFLGGLRSALLEQQALSRFFAGLSDLQQGNLLSAFRELSRTDAQQRRTIQTLSSQSDENQRLIESLQATVREMGQDYQLLKERVTQLEAAQNA